MVRCGRLHKTKACGVESVVGVRCDEGRKMRVSAGSAEAGLAENRPVTMEGSESGAGNRWRLDASVR